MNLAKYSGYDSLGLHYIDCYECKRGPKGNRNCSSGLRINKPNMGMCYSGELLNNLTMKSYAKPDIISVEKGAATQFNGKKWIAGGKSLDSECDDIWSNNMEDR